MSYVCENILKYGLDWKKKQAASVIICYGHPDNYAEAGVYQLGYVSVSDSDFSYENYAGIGKKLLLSALQIQAEKAETVRYIASADDAAEILIDVMDFATDQPLSEGNLLITPSFGLFAKTESGKVHEDVLSQGPDIIISAAEHIYACSSVPANRSDADTHKLAAADVLPEEFSWNDYTEDGISGKKLIFAAKSNITVAESGDIQAYCLTDQTRLLAVQSIKRSQPLVKGGLLNLPALEIISIKG
ncbi:MAG: hypothetical protein GY749_06935 [Desulfobacteraceae bacterium]|nr:hypothetical protein [Desulfobacteraceae bacterium]